MECPTKGQIDTRVHHKNTQKEEEIGPLKWQLGSMGVRKTSFSTIQHETCYNYFASLGKKMCLDLNSE
jgi:hypothetical protein